MYSEERTNQIIERSQMNFEGAPIELDVNMIATPLSLLLILLVKNYSWINIFSYQFQLNRDYLKK